MTALFTAKTQGCYISTNTYSTQYISFRLHYATVSSDDPKFAITFNYELLDDSYCLFAAMDDDVQSAAKFNMDAEEDSTVHHGPGLVRV